MKVDVTRSVRTMAKDTLSICRQALGLRHDYTKRRVRYLKTRNDATADQDRIEQISAAFGLSAEVVESYVKSFEVCCIDDPELHFLWRRSGRDLMSIRDQKTLFALACAAQPVLCVETGASGGASTTALLAGMRRGPQAAVHSIDLMSDDARYFGQLIPGRLRRYWHLHLQGNNEVVLPSLLGTLWQIDFFLHDSNHTWKHMTWEYETAWPRLSPGGCLASHDVLCNNAFATFVDRHRNHIAATGLIGNFGFCVKA